MTRSVAVFGGGAWGTALARHLASGGDSVRLWVHDPALASAIASRRENPAYLPGFQIPSSVGVTPSIAEAASGAGIAVIAVPSHHAREILSSAAPHFGPGLEVVIASKGIENDTLLTVSRVAASLLGSPGLSGLAVLSGPSFAREVAAGRPTAIVAASVDPAFAARVQGLFTAGNLRVYTSSDVVGVELGGALKNVMAIAAGVVEGLAFGPNTLAALMTRGLAEMSRLALACGGRRETLAGLSGLGDLVLTCTGEQSRNRRVGVELGRGRRLDEILQGQKSVAEGVRTSRSALDLARRQGLTMPITQQVNEVLFEGRSPADAIRELLSRPVRPEED